MEGYLILTWLLSLAVMSLAVPLRSQNTLVLVDNMAFIETHSLFFDLLKGSFLPSYHTLH